MRATRCASRPRRYCARPRNAASCRASIMRVCWPRCRPCARGPCPSPGCCARCAILRRCPAPGSRQPCCRACRLRSAGSAIATPCWPLRARPAPTACSRAWMRSSHSGPRTTWPRASSPPCARSRPRACSRWPSAAITAPWSRTRTRRPTPPPCWPASRATWISRALRWPGRSSSSRACMPASCHTWPTPPSTATMRWCWAWRRGWRPRATKPGMRG